MRYEIVTFANDEVKLDVNVSPGEDTVWLSKEEMAILFQRDRSVISRHIANIYKEGELLEESTCAKNAHVHSDKRQRQYENYLYNLDVIISVGYRVKSQNGVLFRKWANSVLKGCLLKGYVINENRALVTNKILESDLDDNQVVAKNATTGNDGKTYIVTFYNLDVIIPLGYKVHSQNGIMFREWANRVSNMPKKEKQATDYSKLSFPDVI